MCVCAWPYNITRTRIRILLTDPNGFLIILHHHYICTRDDVPPMHLDSLFPTVYMVLTLVTTFYGKRGDKLCNDMHVTARQGCRDLQGFIIMPILVEMVGLASPVRVPCVCAMLLPR